MSATRDKSGRILYVVPGMKSENAMESGNVSQAPGLQTRFQGDWPVESGRILKAGVSNHVHDYIPPLFIKSSNGPFDAKENPHVRNTKSSMSLSDLQLQLSGLLKEIDDILRRSGHKD